MSDFFAVYFLKVELNKSEILTLKLNIYLDPKLKPIFLLFKDKYMQMLPTVTIHVVCSEGLILANIIQHFGRVSYQ